MTSIGLPNSQALQSRFAGDGAILTDSLRDTEINRDRNLGLPYVASLTPESQAVQEIFQAMVSRRKPAGLLGN